MNYWLVKSDPEEYGWNELTRDKKTNWTGVRSYAARNHLKAMEKGDEVLFYHSGGESAVVGIAKVTKPFFPDTTADEEGWVAVELAPVKAFKQPVPLSVIKNTSALKNMILLKISRLSVQPVQQKEYEKVMEMGMK